MNFKTNRFLDQPIGDPFSGPAYYGKPWLSARPGYRDVVKDILEYQSNAGQDARDLYRKDPERIFIGANTPFESEVWGKILGKDYEPTVDMYGGTTSYNSKTASERGINTGPGEAMHSIARAITTFFAGGALSNAMGGGEAAAAGTEGLDASTGQFAGETASSGVAGGETTLAEGQAGVSTSGAEFNASSGASTQAAAPTATSTATPLAETGTVMPPAVESMPPAVVDPAAAAAPPPTTAGGGLIQSAMDFAKAHPTLTAAGLMVGGSAVQGAGARANQKEIADRQIQAQRDLQAQRQQQAIELEEWKRKFAQSGSYFDALIPFRRRPNSPLIRASTGTPVFQNGLIATAMNNGGGG